MALTPRWCGCLATLLPLAFAASTARPQDEDGFRFHGYLRSGFGVETWW